MELVCSCEECLHEALEQLLTRAVESYFFRSRYAGRPVVTVDTQGRT